MKTVTLLVRFLTLVIDHKLGNRMLGQILLPRLWFITKVMIYNQGYETKYFINGEDFGFSNFAVIFWKFPIFFNIICDFSAIFLKTPNIFSQDFHFMKICSIQSIWIQC